MSKTAFFVSYSLWVGGFHFSQKMNDKDIPQENLRNFKKNPCGKASVVKSALNNIARIDAGPVTYLRRGFQQRGFLTTT